MSARWPQLRYREPATTRSAARSGRSSTTSWGPKSLTSANSRALAALRSPPFRARDLGGHSTLLQAAEESFAAVKKYQGNTFAIWTTHEDWLLLRNPQTTELTPVYRALLRDFKRHKEATARGRARQGFLFFDHRGRTEDMGTGCAVQNFVVRVGLEWREHFIQTPHFTPSAISPGLQAADLVAYLAAHQHDPAFRSELVPYWGLVRDLASGHPSGTRSSLRMLDSDPRKEKGRRGKAPKRR